MSFFDPLTRLAHALVCCLRRARSASRSKPSPRAVPGRGRSAETGDESEPGSANFFGPALGRDSSFGGLIKLHDSLVRCWKKKSAQIAHMNVSHPLTVSVEALVCCLRRARSASRTKPVPRAVPGRGRSVETVDGSETGSANFFGPTQSLRLRS